MIIKYKYFIDSIKRAGLYSEKSPISVTIKLRKLDWPAEIYESDIEYIVSNKSTKQTSKFTFKGNCSIEGDNASIGHSSDVLGCTIRKNYAKFINHISMPSKENLVCK